MNKIHIVSDGTEKGTHVYNDTGEKINNVARVEIIIDATHGSRAFLEIVDFDVDIQGAKGIIETIDEWGNLVPNPVDVPQKEEK